MTQLLIGTYRKRKHITACLRAVEERLSGYDDVIFIDDSGDHRHSRWLAQYGKVIETGGVGYAGAYKALCEAAAANEGFVLEEDFMLTGDVSLPELSEHLYNRPYLAQISLLRESVTDRELLAGGIIPDLTRRGYTFTEVAGLIEHDAIFTCNPSLWRGHVFELGWPQCPDSEQVKTGQLATLGYRFAYLPSIRCDHRGERSGHGY